jgi:hypothetical protein
MRPRGITAAKPTTPRPIRTIASVRVTVLPGDVVSGNSVIGRDTDPFIRDQLLREYNSGRPD